MEQKNGYKHTEIGVIPKDWGYIRFGDLIKELKGGANLSPLDFRDTGIPVIPKSGVTRGCVLKIRDADQQFCDPNLRGKFTTSLVDNSYTIIVLRDLVPSGPNIGLIVRIESSEEHVMAQGVYGFITKPEVSPSYLAQLSNSEPYRRLMKSILVGSTQVHIRSTTLKETCIPLPPSNIEQTAIGNALSDVDALIQSLIRLITKKRQIKQGAMQILLNPYENGSLKEGWVVKKLGDVFEISAGGDLRKNEFSKIADQKHHYPIYSNALTKRGLYGYCESFDYLGTFITVTARGGVGFAVARNCAFAAIGRLLVLKPISNTDCQFVAEYINLRVDFANESTGVPQLTAPEISKYEIALPQDGSEQIRIATILSDMDADIAALETKLTKTQQIKQGMMQNLLTGKIRLVSAQKVAN